MNKHYLKILYFLLITLPGFTGQIQSFDIFDTLVGRLNCTPDSIFQIVEKNYPFPNFKYLRKLAEQQSDGTLDDTYRKFQKLSNLSDQQILNLKTFEFQTELSEVFPITENVRLVNDGDILVSDTYYNITQLKKILEKIGLAKNVEIYAFPNGKSSGLIWEKLSKEKSISLHIGDNNNSDVLMAKYHNIPAKLYSNCQLSSHELNAIKMGQSSLAYLMRALRLQNPYHPNSFEYLLWNEQSQLNVPILVQASLFLDEFCKEKQKNHILFTSRDCCLWKIIFQKLFPNYTSTYFHSSRYVYLNPSSSYLDYVKNIYTNDTLIVDGQGSGKTCTDFFQNYLNVDPIYLAIVNSGNNHHAIVRLSEWGCSDKIEKINNDLIGTLCDFQDKTPIRDKLEYDIKFVYPAHQCIKKCEEIISRYTFKTFNKEVITYFLKSLEYQIISDKLLYHALDHETSCNSLCGNKK